MKQLNSSTIQDVVNNGLAEMCAYGYIDNVELYEYVRMINENYADKIDGESLKAISELKNM